MEQRQKNKLKAIVQRIENLEEQKRDLSREVKDLYEGAKNAGFSTRAIKEAIKLAREDETTRAEHQNTLTEYCHALGVQLELPGLQVVS